MDQLICGDESNLLDSLKCWRIRYVILPTEYSLSSSENSKYLVESFLKFQKLIFHNNRIFKNLSDLRLDTSVCFYFIFIYFLIINNNNENNNIIIINNK